METKHTPGPWEANKHDCRTSENVGIFYRTAIHGNPQYVASVYGEGALSNRTEERDANVRLIAAAPDLLAVCIGMEKYMGLLPHAYRLTDPDRARLREAIRKATQS